MSTLQNKKISRLVTVLALTILICSCKSSETKKQAATTDVYYTCSMHPQVHQSQPGNCPICGMKLIKVSLSNSNPTIPVDSALSYLTEPVTQTVIGSFKVITPVSISSADTITATGHIDFDKRDINTISARVSGRIDQLYIQYPGQQIRKGQALMKIYSPQLVKSERDLLQAIQQKDRSLTESLKEQLLNLGMPISEIDQVMRSKQLLTQVTIYSPYDGMLSPVDPPAEISGKSMPMQPGVPVLRKGMYVHTGQNIFSIQNIRSTWAILNIFTTDMPDVDVGDPVVLYADAAPGRSIKGRISFIPPYRSPEEKTTAIRVYLSALPAHWKIGSLIHGRITTRPEDSGEYVPSSAINHLGTRDIVWVQDERHANVFHAREVETGTETAGTIQIISGLRRGERIAENAAYMVDSDSFTELTSH